MKIKDIPCKLIVFFLMFNQFYLYAYEQRPLENHSSYLRCSTLAPRSFMKNIYTSREISQTQQAESNTNIILRNLKVAGLSFAFLSVFSLSDIIPFFTISKAYAGEDGADVTSLTNYLGIAGTGTFLTVIASYIGIKTFFGFQNRKQLLKAYEDSLKPFKQNLEGKSGIWRAIYNYAWSDDKKNPQKGNWDETAIFEILSNNYNNDDPFYIKKNKNKSPEEKEEDQTFYDESVRKYFKQIRYYGKSVRFFDRTFITALTNSLKSKSERKEEVYFGSRIFQFHTLNLKLKQGDFPEHFQELIFQKEFSQFVMELKEAIIHNYVGKVSDRDMDNLLKNVKIDLTALKNIYYREHLENGRRFSEQWKSFVADNSPDMEHLKLSEKNVSLYDLQEFIYYLDSRANEEGLLPGQEFFPKKFTFFKIAA